MGHANAGPIGRMGSSHATGTLSHFALTPRAVAVYRSATAADSHRATILCIDLTLAKPRLDGEECPWLQVYTLP